MKFDGTFKDFLKKRKGFAKPLLILMLGAIFVFFSFGSLCGEEEEYEEDSLAVELQTLLESVEGVGKCRVMISYRESGGSYYSRNTEKTVYAVAVVCRGADSALVSAKVRDMVSATFGIGVNRVTVLKMK